MMRVEVYWNLHLKLFSIRSRGKVIGHASRVLVRDAEFVVQPAGNARVRETGHKVVHAFVRGQLEGWQGETTTEGDRRYLYPIWDASDRRYARAAHEIGHEVTYNPRVNTTFVAGAQEITKSAGMVFLSKVNGKATMRDFDTLKMPENV